MQSSCGCSDRVCAVVCCCAAGCSGCARSWSCGRSGGRSWLRRETSRGDQLRLSSLDKRAATFATKPSTNARQHSGRSRDQRRIKLTQCRDISDRHLWLRCQPLNSHCYDATRRCIRRASRLAEKAAEADRVPVVKIMHNVWRKARNPEERICRALGAERRERQRCRRRTRSDGRRAAGPTAWLRKPSASRAR